MRWILGIFVLLLIEPIMYLLKGLRYIVKKLLFDNLG